MYSMHTEDHIIDGSQPFWPRIGVYTESWVQTGYVFRCPRRNRTRNTSLRAPHRQRVTLPPAQIERRYPGTGTPSLLIFWKAPQRLFAVAKHVRDQPSRIWSRLMDFCVHCPRLFVEAVKITVATVTDHSLAETQARQPLIKFFTVGFFWLGRGAVRRKGVLPAAQICPEHVADGLPNIFDLRYSHRAVVLFPCSADEKCFFEITFFRFRDDLVNLANPMWLQVFWSQ
jgi:hypothetical protein